MRPATASRKADVGEPERRRRVKPEERRAALVDDDRPEVDVLVQRRQQRVGRPVRPQDHVPLVGEDGQAGRCGRHQEDEYRARSAGAHRNGRALPCHPTRALYEGLPRRDQPRVERRVHGWDEARHGSPRRPGHGGSGVGAETPETTGSTTRDGCFLEWSIATHGVPSGLRLRERPGRLVAARRRDRDLDPRALAVGVPLVVERDPHQHVLAVRKRLLVGLSQGRLRVHQGAAREHLARLGPQPAALDEGLLVVGPDLRDRSPADRRSWPPSAPRPRPLLRRRRRCPQPRGELT